MEEDNSRNVLINGRTHLIPEADLLQEFKPVPRKISRVMYSESRSHARAFGPGGEGFEVPHVKRVDISEDTITAMMRYINNDEHIQQLACGAKTLTLSTGQTLKVPSVSRKILRSHLWSRYVKDHTDSDGKYFGDFKKKKFMETLEAATDGDQKTYAALDQVKVRCGTENFESGVQLLSEICCLDVSFAGLKEYHLKKLTRYREHCKSGLPSHLKLRSRNASHCIHHLLGGQGPHSVTCDHEHTDHCEDCDYGRVFIKTLRNMVSTLKDKNRLSGEALEDMQWRISDFESKHDKYVGHIIRGYHEINKKNELFRNLAVGDVIEVADWKMKFMMHLYRYICTHLGVTPQR